MGFAWTDAVAEAVGTTIYREELRRKLEGVLDLERLLSRMTLETANARDLLALAASFGHLPEIKLGLDHLNAARLQQLNILIDPLADVCERIDRSIVTEPPLSLSDGGVIRSGVDAELDELRDLSRNSKQYIAQIEERERQRTGINSLKIKFNSIFGYYLEVTRPNLPNVPSDYQRRQSLVSAERFVTPDLKEREALILTAEARVDELEAELFQALLRKAAAAQVNG